MMYGVRRCETCRDYEADIREAESDYGLGPNLDYAYELESAFSDHLDTHSEE